MFGRNLLVIRGVGKLGDDLSRMAVRVEVVCVLVHFLLGALLAAVPRENVLVVVKVVVIVLVEESFRHIYVGFGNFFNN